ncbi:ABC transporter permease [Corynebacterium bovis]|uniref:ABC transporter permease n=1 Tax=Corynebacterium bovis TaxID=36808 RepID=UPI00244A0661|nr:ABC transporter permease [Corynebacterium bovis]MDH2456465.1 ABC transporter permease [Corynebacterium bovis]
MNLGHAIRAEWIKLRSTKSLYWTSALVIVFSVAVAAMMGFGAASVLNAAVDSGDPGDLQMALSSFNPEAALVGPTVFGIMVVIIQAVMTVTSEYGHGTAKPTALALPGRWQAPVAKVLVYAVLAAVTIVVAAVLSLLVAHWTAAALAKDTPFTDDALRSMSFSGEHAWAETGMIALYAVLVVPLSVGTGYLVRHTAGAIAVLLLWKLVVETAVVGLIPKIRDWLPPYMPFGNMDSATQLSDVTDAPWGWQGSAVYFAVWSVVIFVAGIVVLRRRDA